ncbi:Oxoglutarate/iron-dependent dioxygenase [Corchorus olitorius]|uniref:Oxoglutarate/iron-dependent dioxygenase n=1 Tax=Corchorus olitorius TaxID=93759 RepID=A0A1R3G2D0_9ROSI|nr:Oxoglutarate/iron-dependent dioxygenase [Corchorus olitorius]
MSGEEDYSCSFSIGDIAQEKGLPYVPQRYVVSPSNRSSLNPHKAEVPTIDMVRLRQNDGEQRSMTIKELGDICRHGGFFQLILDEALSMASGFFNLPTEKKMKLSSNDVYKPVRYGTSLKDGVDKVQFWRVFLKHYAYPLDAWIDSWPENPLDYRKLALELMRKITESLGLGPNYLGEKMEDGMQVMAVNCYPPCPEPDIALGLPPHSDYTCLTIVLQNAPGLEILDTNDAQWKIVPHHRGVLQVQIGDHFEVLSNGLCKSVVHRAILNSERTRISIASLHSLGIDDKVGPAEELVDEQHPKKYKESSFRDFLDFLASNDIGAGKISFNESLKL